MKSIKTIMRLASNGLFKIEECGDRKGNAKQYFVYRLDTYNNSYYCGLYTLKALREFIDSVGQ